MASPLDRPEGVRPSGLAAVESICRREGVVDCVEYIVCDEPMLCPVPPSSPSSTKLDDYIDRDWLGSVNGEDVVAPEECSISQETLVVVSLPSL